MRKLKNIFHTLHNIMNYNESKVFKTPFSYTFDPKIEIRSVP